MTRNQVVGIRFRAEALLQRSEVRAAYDELMAEHDLKESVRSPVLPAPAAPKRRPVREAQQPVQPSRSVPPPVVPEPISPAVAEAVDLATTRHGCDALDRIPAGMTATATAVGLLRNDTCRWPLGDPADATFKFCGAPKPVERSYCPACANLAYSGRAPTFAPRAVVLGKPRRAA